MKRSKLFRKKLLPLFLSVAVAGSQVPVMAADFGDTAVVSADADETERSQSIRNQGQTGERYGWSICGRNLRYRNGRDLAGK